MPLTHTIQRFARLTYILSTIVALSVLAFIILLYIGFHDSKLAWANYSNHELSIRFALSDLSRNAGYGGFIHDFKNLVLRRDLPRYQKRIDSDIKNVRAGIARLGQLLKQEPDRHALANFQSTFDKYVRNYAITKKLIAKGLSPTQIDKIVKIPNGDAINALRYLSTTIDNRVAVAARNHSRAMRQLFYIGIGGGGYIFVLLLLTSGAEIWLTRRLVNIDIELKNTQTDLQRANSALTIFLGSMSHEMRTPLTAVMGFAQLLEMKLSEGELKSHAQEIVNAGNYMIHLVNELLDLTAIETGNVKFQFDDHDMVVILRECIDIIRPLAEKRSIEIENKVKPGESVPTHVDVRRIQQVLLNILSNAVKFNREHGRITVDIKPIENRIRINIIDTGRGLTEAQIEKIFVPFDRLGADERQVEGAGLGMAISKELLEKMDGEIGLESEPGTGTRVWVSLPLTQPSA